MICYDDYKLFNRLHYAVNWLLIGVFYFLIESLVLSIAETEFFPVTRLILTLVVVSGLPIAIVLFKQYFTKAFLCLDSIVNVSSDDFSQWLKENQELIFSFRNRSIILTVLITDIVITAVVLLLELPFDQNIVIWALVFLLPISAIGGHAVYIVIRLVMFLYGITNSPIKVPFNYPSRLSLQPVLRFFSRITIVGFFLYIFHFISFLFSNYAMSIPIMIWMAFIGFFPFVLFTFSIYQIHVLMSRIKEFHIDQVNYEIQKVFERLKENPSHNDAETLEVLMRIQQNLEGSKVWPISAEGFTTLVITLFVPVAQIAVTVIEP
jgi:hypothetical protein